MSDQRLCTCENANLYSTITNNKSKNIYITLLYYYITPFKYNFAKKKKSPEKNQRVSHVYPFA